MSDSISKSKKILQEMYDEFLKEEKRLTDICNGHSVRIDELEHKIHAFRKSEDVDFKVFSPRSSSNVNTDKISDLEKEKESLELESRNFSKQLRYYSDKVNKLNEVLILLGDNDIKESLSVAAFSDVPEKIEPEIEVDPFDEFFPARKDNQIQNNNVQKDDYLVGEEDGEKKVNSNIAGNFENSELSEVIDKNPLIVKDEVNNIIHKVEFTEKIVSTDSIRAKLELKEIVRLLKELFK